MKFDYATPMKTNGVSACGYIARYAAIIALAFLVSVDVDKILEALK